MPTADEIETFILFIFFKLLTYPVNFIYVNSYMI